MSPTPESPAGTPGARRGRLGRALSAAWRELRGQSAPAAPAPGPRRTSRAVFQAADSNRFNLNWRVGNSAADTDIRGALAVTRARGRDLARNNPYIERYLGLLVSNVIGPHGVGHQAQVRTPDGQLDEDVNEYLEEKWCEWKDGPVTADGKLTLNGFSGLQLETCAVDGEAFTRRLIRREFRHGIALQPIDPDLVAETINRRFGRDGEEVRLGVAVDEFGKPIGYEVWDWPEYVPGSMSRGLERLSAEEVFHHYRPRRAHQTRGVTWLARVMTEIQDLAGYDEAVIIGARAGASQVGFIEWKDPAAGSPTLSMPDGTEQKPSQYELNPGTVTELDPGQTFNGFDPSQPSGMYADFTKTVLRRIASGLGVSYASIANDLREVNFSSTKVGLQTEREMWRILQDWWISTHVQPIYNAWLEAGTLSGALVLPRADWRLYTAVKWTPRGWDSPERAREAQVTQSELELGLTSRQRILSERGEDFSEVLEELAQERAAAAAAGISIDAPAPSAPAAGAATDPSADPPADPNADPSADGEGTARSRIRSRLRGGSLNPIPNGLGSYRNGR